LVPSVHKARKACQVRSGRPDLRALSVRKDPLDPKDSLDPKDRLEQKETLELKVHKA
jgi:hypothetical protein